MQYLETKVSTWTEDDDCIHHDGKKETVIVNIHESEAISADITMKMLWQRLLSVCSMGVPMEMIQQGDQGIQGS